MGRAPIAMRTIVLVDLDRRGAFAHASPVEWELVSRSDAALPSAKELPLAKELHWDEALRCLTA